MSFVVKKLRPAEEDALEAAIWYEGRQVGLGDDFLNEVDRAVQALADDGLHHRIRSADVRRKPIHRFKFYGIYYVIRENEIWILAIFTEDAIPGRYKNALDKSADVLGQFK